MLSGGLLTSLTNHFILNVPQLAGVQLMLRVKCSEHRLYLDVFIAVFLHLLPPWDLSPRWRWLTQIYSSPLPSAPATLHRELECFSLTPLLLLVLFSPIPLLFPSGPASFLSPLYSHFLFTRLHQEHRIYIQLTGCLTDWLNEYLTLTELWSSLRRLCIHICICWVMHYYTYNYLCRAVQYE